MDICIYIYVCIHTHFVYCTNLFIPNLHDKVSNIPDGFILSRIQTLRSSSPSCSVNCDHKRLCHQ